MTIRTDPDTPAPGETQNADPAAAAAGADAGKDAGAQQPEPKVDGDAAAIAAFDRGVAEAKGETPAPAAGADDAGKDGAQPGAGDEGKTPEQIAAEAAAGKDGKPEGKPEGEGDGQQPPAKDEAVEKEITDLGLKDRAAARFRELTTRVAEIEPLRARAARADEWEHTVVSTGATPEQFGATLQYLRDINSGDPAKMREGYDRLLKEVQDLGGMLGLAAPGGVDPLEAHPDLKQMVSELDITREVALELAQRRQAEKLARANADRQNTVGQQEAAVNAGLQQVQVLGGQLRAADPAGFDAKFKLISPMIARIQKTLPPSEWVGAIKEAWDVLPTVAAPKPKPAPSHQQLRPTGASAGQLPKPKNDVEAFDFGVNMARAAGQ